MLFVFFILGGKYTFIIFLFKLFTEVSHTQTAKQDQEFQTHLYWEIPPASQGILGQFTWANKWPLSKTPESLPAMPSMGTLSPGLSIQKSFWLMRLLPILCVIIWVSLAVLWFLRKGPMMKNDQCMHILEVHAPPQTSRHPCSHPHAPSLCYNMLSSASLSPYLCPSPSHHWVGLCPSVTSALFPLIMALLTFAATTGCAQVGTVSHQGKLSIHTLGPTLPRGLTWVFHHHLKASWLFAVPTQTFTLTRCCRTSGKTLSCCGVIFLYIVSVCHLDWFNQKLTDQ